MTPPPELRVLVLFAHPALERSTVHRELVKVAQTVTGVTFRDLYELYPDFQIDVREEQRLLVEHDAIVMQHPFYWYNVPALLKEWLDLVLEYGFAYGHEGEALRGKLWLHATSTGGQEEAYRSDGRNRFTMRELLAPFDQSAHLCGMHYLPPFVVHGALGLDTAAEVESYAACYRALLEALRDGRLDRDAARGAERLNELVPAPTR
jgi:glutathione-regulated potassium-efflux system ancillary protein KefG